MMKIKSLWTRVWYERKERKLNKMWKEEELYRKQVNNVPYLTCSLA